MTKTKYGYQGIRGAYSEVAIFSQFGKDIETFGFETFEDVFKALKDGRIDYAVLPFENILSGSIVQNYDLLLKEDVFIINEILLKIKHVLLAGKGVKLENIDTVYSHPHALAQCNEFLKNHKIVPIPSYDTAGAARFVHEHGKINEAAIASELCAEIYELDVIARNIESTLNNLTKFFVLSRKSDVPKNVKQEKSCIAFKTKHYPGALVNCLQRLAKNNINLTRLESRPIQESHVEYIFYTEFEGGIKENNVDLAIREMEAASIFLKILGSYPKGKLLG